MTARRRARIARFVFFMADSADSAPPRRSRASSKRRAAPASSSSISADTENKLARAVQSAQRLAQLSDAPREDGTLDLFPDDPTRALVESMTIDVRQGTLSGFELPPVVRAAVEAAHGANAPPAPATSRRPARSKELTAGGGDGVEAEAGATSAGERDDGAASVGTVESGVAGAGDVAAQDGAVPGTDGEASAAGALAPAPGVGAAGALAGAHAARASVARREAGADATAPAGDGAMSTPTGDEAADVREISHTQTLPPDVEAGHPSAPHDAANLARAVANGDAAAFSDAARALRAGEPRTPPARPALHAARQSSSASPELDRARATAFADTVDALYGVIADQRRAAADLTRRMKWMLAIVAGALLVTVGVGITQTLLLSRLARDAATQQQRAEQMLQTQQAALAGLLERVAVPASAPATPPAVAAHSTPSAPVQPHPLHGRRAHRPAR